jgi:outer membrane receptor protein involved in Fe transport
MPNINRPARKFYGTYNWEGLNFIANATYSRAKKAGAGSNVFARADGIPNLTYTLNSNYDVNEYATVGLSATGQTSSIDGGGLSYPGGTVFGGVLKIRPVENLELGMQVYNLFNKFDFRGNGGVTDGGVTPSIIGGAPALGRTFTASIKYKF